MDEELLTMLLRQAKPPRTPCSRRSRTGSHPVAPPAREMRLELVTTHDLVDGLGVADNVKIRLSEVDQAAAVEIGGCRRLECSTHPGSSQSRARVAAGDLVHLERRQQRLEVCERRAHAITGEAAADRKKARSPHLCRSAPCHGDDAAFEVG